MIVIPEPGGNVLVSDFDGTMTRQDFYKLAVEFLLPADFPNYLQQYRNGTITHFEALRRYFAAITASEAELLELVAQMDLDPLLPQSVQQLQAAGWNVIVTSAGCAWYIRHILNDAGVGIEVHANPGRLEPGQGLVMEPPHDSPYFSPQFGVSKAAVVRKYQKEGRTVAFAGDSVPDAEAARLVAAEWRFARADLARLLDEEGLGYQRFERWSEIARKLLSQSGVSS